MARNQRTSTDRFGRTYSLKAAKQVKNKQGEKLDIFKTFVEIKGQLYSIEISENKKDYDDDLDRMWVKVTKIDKRKNSSL